MTLLSLHDGEGAVKSHLIARVTAAGPAHTERLGFALGTLLSPGDLINLIGDLGAGKTLFVKGIARALGYDPGEVRSPTFTLINEYHGTWPLYHLDLYRLDDVEADLEGLGYEAYFEPERAVTAVEWGALARDLLPERRFDVEIAPHPEGRLISIFARGMEQERVDALREKLKTWDEVG